MSQIIDLIAAVFVFCGALLTLCSAIGLARFKDTLSRMHPAAKPQVLGLVLVISGAILRVWPSVDIGMIVLSGLAAVCTAPIIANRVGNTAYRESADQDISTDDIGPSRS